MTEIICESCAEVIEVGELATRIQRAVVVEITGMAGNKFQFVDVLNHSWINICANCTAAFVLSQFHSRKLRVELADEVAYRIHHGGVL